MSTLDPIDALAEAVYEAHRKPDPIDALAEAVTAAFAARPAPVAAEQARALARADLVTRHREWQAASRRRYGDPQELMARLEARGGRGLSARVWC